jgi:hypothetical protein
MLQLPLAHDVYLTNLLQGQSSSCEIDVCKKKG